MKVTVGYTYHKDADVPVCVEWICSKCGYNNKKLEKLHISGSTQRGVYSPKEGVEKEVMENFFCDLKNKLSLINSGKYVNLGLDDCVCKKCRNAEAWSYSIKKPTPISDRLLSAVVMFDIILCLTAAMTFHSKWICVLIVILSILIVNKSNLIYLRNKSALQKEMNKIQRDNLPRIRIEEEADRVEEFEQRKKEAIDAGGWVCGFCGGLNSANIGFCKCGKSKGESKIKASENNNAKVEEIGKSIKSVPEIAKVSDDQNYDNNRKGKKIYLESDYGRLMYAIEHQLMRDEFFKAPERFLGSIFQARCLYGLIDKICKSNNVVNRIQPTEIKVNPIRIDDDNHLLLIEFPDPEYVPLCYRIYYATNRDYSRNEMYLIEAAKDGGYLCKWDGPNHINLHMLKEPSWNDMEALFKSIEIKMIADLFMGKSK